MAQDPERGVRRAEAFGGHRPRRGRPSLGDYLLPPLRRIVLTRPPGSGPWRTGLPPSFTSTVPLLTCASNWYLPARVTLMYPVHFAVLSEAIRGCGDSPFARRSATLGSNRVTRSHLPFWPAS